MRILHVDDQFIPALGYEAELAKTQLEMGHDVSFAASRDLPELKDLSPDQRGESPVPHDLLWTLRLGRRSILMPGLVRAMFRNRPEVVHCHSIFDMTALLVALFKPVLGYRLVYCCHVSTVNSDLDSTIARRIAYKTFNMVVGTILRWAADAVTAVAENERAVVARALGIADATVPIVRLGTDISGLKPDPEARAKARAQWGFEDSDVVLVHAGTITPAKELELLIDVASNIYRPDLRVRLLIVGGGDLEPIGRLKQQINATGLQDQVLFIDRFVDKKSLIAVYQAGDVACWPGEISIATLEAMAIGLPMILKDGDDYRDFLVSSQNGVTYAASQSKSLASAIERLAGDADLRQCMGARSRELAEREFDWRSIASRFIELYTSA